MKIHKLIKKINKFKNKIKWGSRCITILRPCVVRCLIFDSRVRKNSVGGKKPSYAPDRFLTKIGHCQATVETSYQYKFVIDCFTCYMSILTCEETLMFDF